LTRDDLQRIADIRDAAADIANVVALGRESFLTTTIHQRGVERLLEIVGEAANKLSREVKLRHPDVNWRDIGRLRILLAHRYHRVDPALVWVIAEGDVPELVAALAGEEGRGGQRRRAG